MTISDEEIRRAVDATWLARSPIVDRAEAMAYCRIKSQRSWYRFCQRTGLQPQTDGRYSRTKVERAAVREERIAA